MLAILFQAADWTQGNSCDQKDKMCEIKPMSENMDAYSYCSVKKFNRDIYAWIVERLELH